MTSPIRWFSGLLLMVTLWLSGCATGWMDPSAKTQIKTIAVSVQLNKPDPVVLRPGAGMAALLTGGLGLAAMNDDQLNKRYGDIVRSQVDVPALIYNTSKQMLEQRGYRVVPAGQPADARIVISGNYSLGTASLTTDASGAGASLRGEMMRGNDTAVIWRRVAMGLNVDKAQKARLRTPPFAQWFTDMALVKEQHDLTTRMTVEELFKDF